MNVRPSLDELELFHHGAGEKEDEAPEDKLIRLARMASAGGEDQTFIKGDTVKVCRKNSETRFFFFFFLFCFTFLLFRSWKAVKRV